MKHVLIFIFVILIYSSCKLKRQENNPKLVVGVVIDQMRAEYLYRFQDNYTENGFKRLLREGFNVKNVHYNYVPTVTGPGHASIYTGTTSTNHGIVSNSWYSRELKKTVYCAGDTTAFLVDNFGIISEQGTQKISSSPRNLKTTTITDELKLFTNSRSKVIGLSIKDRGAIFPAGHLADGVYWYNSSNGNFVTSTYYKEELPKWLKNFNNQKIADSLLNLVWEPLLPIEEYKNSGVDDAPFEKILNGRNSSTFPYNLKKLRKENNNFKILPGTPFGNTLLTELVKAALKGESLGQGEETDFLTISYSSTDYIGHHFGIRSKELEDNYIRMDREIAILLDELDRQVGKGNYTLFLTGDHGGSYNPAFLKSMNLPGEFYDLEELEKNLNIYLSEKFGAATYISYMDKTQIYISETETPKKNVLEQVVKFLKKEEGIKEIFVPEFTKFNMYGSDTGDFTKKSYHQKKSGDVFYYMYSGWMEKRSFGSSHGNSYTSDTHVPLIWYGKKIPKGETIHKKAITQIAPTLSMLLDIPFANSSDTNPIEELFVVR